MPWVSNAQRKWGNSPAGQKALGKKGVAEWNRASKKKHKKVNGYTIKVDNKLRGAYGETDDIKKTIRINKRAHRKSRMKRINKTKDGHESLADTIYHETYHAKHPKATEKQTYKKTKQAMREMTPKMRKRLLAMLPK